jgi:hypothetical protein
MWGGASRFYDPTLNKGFNVAPGGDSVTIAVGQSLVSTISLDAAGTKPQLKSAAVLTVLAATPPAGSFRPAFCGTDKSVKYNQADLNYGLLRKLPITAGIESTFRGYSAYWLSHPVTSESVVVPMNTNLDALTGVARMFERPWLDHVHAEEGRWLHPTENMREYGREIARCTSIGALMLHMDFTDAEKKTLLVRYVQLGIDLFGILQDGGENVWTGNGGHCSGRKWPILFAGLALGDTAMSHLGLRDSTLFGEDNMTFYVTRHPNPAAVWTFNGTYWASDGTDETYDIFVPNPAPALDPHPENFDAAGYRRHISYGYPIYGHGNGNKEQDFAEYTDKHAGLPEWMLTSDRCGLDWSAAYRNCGNGEVYGGFIMAADLIPGARTLWNHEAVFDYTDRFVEISGQTSPFAQAVWRAYRADYGCTWTRSDTTDTLSNGRRDCSRCKYDCPTRITKKDKMIPPHSLANRTVPNPISPIQLATLPAGAALHTLDGKPVQADKKMADGVYLIKQGNQVHKTIIVK